MADEVAEYRPYRWEIEPHIDGSYDLQVTDNDAEAKAAILATAEEHLWDQHEGGVRTVRVTFRPEIPEKK